MQTFAPAFSLPFILIYKEIHSYDDASKAFTPPERQTTLPSFNLNDALPK